MKDTIKVCHVIYSISSGGVEQVLINYFSKMEKENLEVYLIYSEEPEKTCKEKMEKAGIKLIQLKYPILESKYKYTKELIKEFKKNKFDIIHCHMNLNNMFSLIAGIISNIKIRISHSHGIEKETSNKLKKYIIRPIKRFLSTKLATNLYSCSEEAGKHLFKNKKFDIIYNAIELEKFNFNPKVREELRKKLNIENNLVIGNVGRFTIDKNHSFIINLFKSIKDKETTSKLILVGVGPLKEQIINQIKKLGLEESVIILDPTDRINDYYQMMDIFLLPSFNEGLGMVLIEAQQNKIPCICSTGIPKTAKISDGITYLNLKEDNMDKWVEECLKYKDKRNKINYNENLNNYDINIQANRLKKIYIDLINK